MNEALTVRTVRVKHSFVICSLVHRYDEMAEKVSEIPDDTEALVELQRYYRKASDYQPV